MLKALDVTSNFIRAVVSLVLVGAVGFGGWVGYQRYYANQLAFEQQSAAIQSLTEQVAAKQKEIDRLGTAVRLLKVDHRVAQLEVIDQRQSAEGTLLTRFNFAEVDDSGRPLEAPREFQIEGDIVFVDSWVVSFEDKFVEEGDVLRGTALYLFKRIFGERQTPEDGFPLDHFGVRPAGYSRGKVPSEAEQEIWREFWEYATDETKAKSAGVRSAQGKASSTKLLPGKRYKLMLRSTGDMTIQPEGDRPNGIKSL